jgi:hypothetical protein
MISNLETLILAKMISNQLDIMAYLHLKVPRRWDLFPYLRVRGTLPLQRRCSLARAGRLEKMIDRGAREQALASSAGEIAFPGEFPARPANSLFRHMNSLLSRVKFPVPPCSGNWGINH